MVQDRSIAGVIDSSALTTSPRTSFALLNLVILIIPPFTSM
ncbi:Uncharacterised protein [Acinetobacter baumannii]|nr:Uncharacterised protein [Acinetobacter baumannii]